MNIALTIAVGTPSWGQMALNWALSVKSNDQSQKTLLIYTPSAIAGIEELIQAAFDYTYNYEEHGIVKSPSLRGGASNLFCQQVQTNAKWGVPSVIGHRSSVAPTAHSVAFHIKTQLYDIVHSPKLRYNKPRKPAQLLEGDTTGNRQLTTDNPAHTFLYMDADTILLPGRRLADWFKIHNVNGIRQRRGALATDNQPPTTPTFTAYCNDTYNYATQQRRRSDYTFWCEPEAAKEYWQRLLKKDAFIKHAIKQADKGISPNNKAVREIVSNQGKKGHMINIGLLHSVADNPQLATYNFTHLPQINTSFLFFNTHPQVKELFGITQQVWNDTKFPYQAYKGAKPDELCFNIACAATNMLPHQVPFRPIFMQCFSESHSHEYILQHYAAFGFAGTEQNPQHLIDWYNQLSEHYRNYAGINMPFALQQHNRVWQDPAPIYIEPLRRHTIARRGDLPNSNGGAFNPDAIYSETHGGIVTILRKEPNMDAYRRKYTNHTAIAHLFTPRFPEGIELNPVGFTEGARIEDFRLIPADDNHYADFILVNHKMVSELKNDDRDMKTCLSIVNAHTGNMAPIGVPALPIELRRTDINWTFFTEGTRIYCIYQLSPYMLFYAEADDNHNTWHAFVFDEQSEVPPLGGGGGLDWFHTGQYICNSTNPILIPGELVQQALLNPRLFIGGGAEQSEAGVVSSGNSQPTPDDFYLTFFHTKESKIYHQGAALINARTKQIDYYTRNSIIIKHPAEAEGLHAGLVYVSGALLLPEANNTIPDFRSLKEDIEHYANTGELTRPNRAAPNGYSANESIKTFNETGYLIYHPSPDIGHPSILRIYFGEADSHAAYHDYNALDMLTAILRNHHESVLNTPLLGRGEGGEDINRSPSPLAYSFIPLNNNTMDIVQLSNRLENTQHPGWCNREKMQALHSLVHQCNQEFNGDILSVEAGVFGGRSLYPMALAHKEIGKGYALGIDTWDNSAPLEGTNSEENAKWWAEVDMDMVYNKFMEGVANLGLRGACRWLQHRTDFAVRLFDDNSITLFHQDGNHSEEVTVREVELWAPKIRNGGYWVVDDMNWPTTAKAYQQTLPLHGFVLHQSFGDWAIFRKEVENK